MRFFFSEWYNRQVPQKLLTLACLLSLISVCLNTPKTFQQFGELRFITFGVDVFVTLLFTVEAAVKMKHRGVVKVSF